MGWEGCFEQWFAAISRVFDFSLCKGILPGLTPSIRCTITGEVSFFGGLHTLGIDDGRARGSFAPLFFGPNLLTQSVVNLLPGPIEPPTAVVIVDRAPGRELVGEVPPLAAGPNED